MQKKHLELFYNLLKGTDGVLNLSESRIRDSVMKTVEQPLIQFGEDRKKIYETFCDKDENGKPDIADGKYKFTDPVLPEVNKELKTLYEEPVNLTLIAGVKEILEKTNYTPKYGEMELVDEIISKL